MAGSEALDQLRQLALEVQREMPRVAQAQPLSRRSAPRTSTRTDTIVDTAIFWAFVAGLAWVPYLWGSNVTEAWGINAVLFPGLAIAYEVSLIVRGASHPVAIKTIRVSAALLVAVVVWILIQNATWTPAFLHHPIWAMAADDLQVPVAGSISVNRDLTTLALVRLLTAASVLWLALQLCRDGSRAVQFVTAFVVISCAYALYGIATFILVQSNHTSSANSLTSTFFNRNHYATYAGMGLVAALGLIVRVYQRDMVTDAGTLRFRIANFIEVTGQKALAPLVAAFLLLIAVVLTGSRGGIIATAFGVIVWATLTFRRAQSASIERRMITILACAVVAAVIMIFGDVFIGRMAEVGLSDSNRVNLYIVALRSIFDDPLLGYGYGTFPDIFPMFRDRSIPLNSTYDQAHNTYLEVFQGLGLFFGSLLLASVLLLALKCYKGAMVRQQITVPAIATAATLLVTVHAMVDFSLQLQAVTLTLMSVLGVGVAQAVSSQQVLAD